MAKAIALGDDRDRSGPQVGVRERDIPGGVATHGMAREINAIGVDGKPPTGIAQAIEHGHVFDGRVAIGFLSRLGPCSAGMSI